VSEILVQALSVFLHGLAYGMVLFLISVGLSITMGLMGFVNLAHGAFAMLGGYVAVTLMLRAGVGYPAAVLLAAAATALVSVGLERALYSRLYDAPELPQVLMTIGLVFVASAAARYVWGPLSQPLQLPAYLAGVLQLGAFSFPIYRLVLIAIGLAGAFALWIGLERTLFGAKIRAAVDNRRMAESVGIDSHRLFTVTFAIGSALAAVGGGLGADLLAISPAYAEEYLVYFMIVVSVGGLGTIRGPFFAAILLGVIDTTAKYLVPQSGAIVIFLATFVVLFWRPQGLLGRAGAVK
jgi:branched-chain amino acid transport system permease protein